MFYHHYSNIPATAWWWKNFTPKELASKGDGSLLVDEDALEMLQELRNATGKPLHINSAYRDEVHNKKVGGSPRSQHLKGTAFDISTRGHDKKELYRLARQVGFTGFGFYNNFLHVDTGFRRTWSMPESARAEYIDSHATVIRSSP